MALVLLLFFGLMVPSTAPVAKPELIILSLIDDLGFADIRPNGPWSPTPHIGALAAQGVQLRHLHAYKYCSPSRRSLLSGRFPVHINGQQAPPCSNFLPLQLTLLSQKLKLAGYSTHFIGKGHLGYQTTDHLPINRGFDTHVGYLLGMENYAHGLQAMCDVPNLFGLPDACPEPHPCVGRWPPRQPADKCHLDYWQNNSTAPRSVLESQRYSTETFAAEMVRLIEAKAVDTPMFVYLGWQAVHGPWTSPPADLGLLAEDDPNYANYCSSDPQPVPPNGCDEETATTACTQVMRCQFGSVLKVLDNALANITAALTQKALWEDTLMLVSADNGGVGPGNNWPLRGQKTTPWQGGTRVAAFLTGGFIPKRLRGTSFDRLTHFADVYPTLCNLVGVSAVDTVVVQGEPRAIDGVDFWPLLLSNASTVLREYLPTTEVSIIWRERYKLITSAGVGGSYWAPPEGKTPSNTVININRTEWPCVNTNATAACLICSPEKPCLFDLSQDEAERVNLAPQQPQLVAQLARQLATYTAYVDGKMASEELAGYDCVSPAYPSEFWGNFTGPCCKPKHPRAHP
jgi:arylsulfatase B